MIPKKAISPAAADAPTAAAAAPPAAAAAPAPAPPQAAEPAAEPPEAALCLLDGYGFLFRAYYATPPLTRADGLPVNAVFGICATLLQILTKRREQAVALVLDAPGPTFRNDLYSEYKAHRQETPEDLIPQFALLRQAAEAFALPCLECSGFEADDILASYAKAARHAGREISILSGDKDMMQLVGPGLTLLDPSKENKVLGEAEVFARFGVEPAQVVDVQALAGDSSDNIPGVPGIGIKTAALLIAEYGDLESVLAAAPDLRQAKRRQALIDHADTARLCQQLARLSDDVPLPRALRDLVPLALDGGRLDAFLAENGFVSLRPRARALCAGSSSQPSANTAAAKAGPQAAQITFGSGVLICTQDELKAWCAEAKAQAVFALDCETDRLDAHDAELVGLALALTPERAAYIPLAHRAKAPENGLLPLPLETLPKADEDATAATAAADATDAADAKDAKDATDTAAKSPTLEDQLPRAEVLAILKPLLEDPGVLKIGHNLKYDMTVLARYGLNITPYDDSMLLSYVLNAGRHAHNLDHLAWRTFGHETIPFSAVIGRGRKQRATFADVPLVEACSYASEDAAVSLALAHNLKPRLRKAGLTNVYETLERPLLPVLLAMEQNGIRVDRQQLSRLGAEFSERSQVLEGEIYESSGERFTIGSPKQLSHILFEKLKLPPPKRTQSGQRTTDAAVLGELDDQNLHPLPGLILAWRQLAKLKSTYIDALLPRIDSQERIHTHFMQNGASTGRLSSNAPNLQNIPIRTADGRRLRAAFIAAPGHLLLSADYSQIELRLMAEIAQEDNLLAAFDAQCDIHTATAAEIFGRAPEDVDHDLRRQAKAINFGLLYGMSAFGLAKSLGIPRGQAQEFITAYFTRYPAIRLYCDRIAKQCRAQGWVETLFGRRVHFPTAQNKNAAAQQRSIERAAINAPVQGSAADIIKRAMIKLPAALRDAGLQARLLLQVHDELVLEVPEDQVEATRALVVRIMIQAPLPARRLRVPLAVDAQAAKNWNEAH